MVGSKKVGEQQVMNSMAGMSAYSRALKLKVQPYTIPLLEDLENWKGMRVLVFAPHQDDEVLGCGGTIKLLAGKAKVRVAYLTNGRQGSADINEDLVEVREKEAIEGLGVLGCDDYVFFGFEDGRLELSPEVIERVESEISDFKPDVLFVVNPMDGPNDHIVSSLAVGEAIRGGKVKFDLFNYEIWNLIMPNRIVDISDVIGMKEKAIKKHHSQMQVINYVHHFLGLNAYRSIYARNCNYCEAFLKMTTKEQVRLCDRVKAQGLAILS